jgi:hypothetical protein
MHGSTHFEISVLDGGKWSASHSQATLGPGEEPIAEAVGWESQSRSTQCKEKHFTPLRGIELRFLGGPARSVVTTPADMYGKQHDSWNNL